MDSKSYEISKSAPVRAGTQGEGKHLVFNGENRKARRAAAVVGARVEKLKAQQQAAAVKAEADVEERSLPKSIWLITALRPGIQYFLDTTVYRISIERRGVTDVMTIYSKEGAAPIVGGLLERMTRPGGGHAAIWTDAKATNASIGGGYTWHAVPAEWRFPEPEPAPEPKAFVNLTLGEPWTSAAIDKI